MSAASSVEPFAARDCFTTHQGPAIIYRLNALEDAGLGRVSRLPYSIRLLLESVLRNYDGFVVTEEDVKNLRKQALEDMGLWGGSNDPDEEYTFPVGPESPHKDLQKLDVGDRQ